jgi:hypothetical protein
MDKLVKALLQKPTPEKSQNQRTLRAGERDFQSANTQINYLTSSPANILKLQSIIGNQAVQRLLSQQHEAVAQRDQQAAGSVDTPMYEIGPQATVDNLRPLVEIRLETWKRAAERGIQLFTNAELKNLIDNPGFDVAGFMTSLIGNIIWAAACFATGGTAFAISLAGIAVGAVGALPKNKPSDNSLSTVENAMQQYIDTIHRHLLSQVNPSCEGVIEQYPGVALNLALNKIMANSFQDRFRTDIENPPWKTEINEEAVRRHFQIFASNRLKDYKAEVNPIVTQEGGYEDHFSGTKAMIGVARVKDLLSYAVVKMTSIPSLTHNLSSWQFVHWIGRSMQDAALEAGKEKWKAAGGWYDPTGSGKWVEWTERMPIPVLEQSDFAGAGVTDDVGD